MSDWARTSAGGTTVSAAMTTRRFMHEMPLLIALRRPRSLATPQNHFEWRALGSGSFDVGEGGPHPVRGADRGLAGSTPPHAGRLGGAVSFQLAIAPGVPFGIAGLSCSI